MCYFSPTFESCVRYRDAGRDVTRCLPSPRQCLAVELDLVAVQRTNAAIADVGLCSWEPGEWHGRGFERVRADPVEGRGRPGVTLGPGRVAYAGSIGLSAFVSSSYRDVIQLWGFTGFPVLLATSFEVTVATSRHLMLGTRAGFGLADGGPSNGDGARMMLLNYDLGFVTRLVHLATVSRRSSVLAAIQIDLGMAGSDIVLRNVAEHVTLPRVAISASLAMVRPGAAPFIRVGYQVLSWIGAGGRGADLQLTGLLLAIGMEGWR